MLAAFCQCYQSATKVNRLGRKALLVRQVADCYQTQEKTLPVKMAKNPQTLAAQWFAGFIILEVSGLRRDYLLQKIYKTAKNLRFFIQKILKEKIPP